MGMFTGAANNNSITDVYRNRRGHEMKKPVLQ
ncbi:hypothetical protein C7475_10967 [Chitinophaga sp. S165]|nr:hypothetical protein C7475_10967 [Chitinophaga sp. S165]